MPKENEYSQIKQNLREKISIPFERSLNKRLTDDQEDGIIEYLKYLDNSFIKDEDYSVSASLAYKALYVNHEWRTDILMYPSVQTAFRGTNFAIQPNFVENNLKLSRIYIVSLDKYEPLSNKVSLIFSKFGIVERNNIIWKNINPNDEFYSEILIEDFGRRIESKFIENNNIQ